ncbi:MAG: ACT domain-containing protein [Thermodesulfobacteriota bacterium]|nr:ACT domain-containing protein [Thermodesulfobacteriota bacterium]
MRVEQISVFLENRTGRLAEVTSILSEAGVNIRALALADTSDFGVLRMIVDEKDKAREVLKANGFTIGTHDVVAVEVKDEPGGLHNILDMLGQSGVNVEYMYAFVRNSGDNAIMIFRFDDIDRAIKILEENSIHIISGQTVYTL